MNPTFGTVPVALLMAVGLLAIGLTSFLSAVELAFSRLSKAFVQDLVEEEVGRAPQLLSLVEHRERTYLSLRGGRVALQTLAMVSLTMAVVGVCSVAGLSWWVPMLIAIAAIGLIEVLAVSLLPYYLVSRNYVKVALSGTWLTGRLVAVFKLFRPLTKMTATRAHPHSDLADMQRLVVAEDLREIVDEVGEPERIDEEDREMLRSVFELGQTLVREVMVPRTAMVTIDAELPLEKAPAVFVRSGFSRIPVIADDIDDVVGILYFKDVVRRMLDHPDSGTTAVRNAARQPVFIPETRFVDDELRAMQASNSHLALVVDEYGGIAGLVTMEDLLEELVGELKDEHDRFEMEPERIDADTWRVPARFHLGDLPDLLDIDVEEDSVDSVGGLLSMALGQVPLPGASAITHGLRLTAEQAVGRRHEVVSVLVQRLAENEEDRVDD